MTDKIILALDASSTAIGWCVGQGGDRQETVNSGTFKPPGESPEARIHEIAMWVRAHICIYDPDLVAIEEPTGHHGNLRTDRLLARACGVIEGVCRSMDPPVDVIYVHPMQVKRTPFHKNATQAAASFVGKEEISGDEADAIGVWQVALGIEQKLEFDKMTAREETP